MLICKGLNPFFFRARLQRTSWPSTKRWPVLIPFSSGLGCSAALPNNYTRPFSLNPFFFRARLQQENCASPMIVGVLIPFSSGLGCSIAIWIAYRMRAVLIPFSSGLGCSSRQDKRVGPCCLNPFFFRARLQLTPLAMKGELQVLIPFSSGLGCSCALVVHAWPIAVLIPFSSGLGCSAALPNNYTRPFSLNPFFFRARLQQENCASPMIVGVLIPFSSGLGCSIAIWIAYRMRAVLIPFSSGLGCSVRTEKEIDEIWS